MKETLYSKYHMFISYEVSIDNLGSVFFCYVFLSIPINVCVTTVVCLVVLLVLILSTG